jgi:hypothetical protein
MALSRKVKSLREGVDSPLRVNVVYQVPGEVVPVNFSGVRTGRYDPRERLLLVQAALPSVMAPNADEVLLGLLDSAINEAERFAQRKGLADRPLNELRSLAHQLREP